MSYPEWADEQLSKDLPILRSRGESQELEYMETFPQQARDLGKEIAAFATSNSGSILIGVADNGDLVGLPEAVIAEGRDLLLRRVEGICTGTIKPAVTPVARFAIESDRIVLVISVSKGRQPIYFSQHIPYVRHITQSRPAEPHEVIDIIQTHTATVTGTSNIKTRDAKGEFYSSLANTLIRVLIYADEINEREVNPWLDLWRTEYKTASVELRELAIQDIAQEDNIKQKLIDLSVALDAVASFRLSFGCGKELDKLVRHAVEFARNLKVKIIDPIPLSTSSLDFIINNIRISSRKLKDIESRANDLINRGRIEEVQSEVSSIGLELLQLAYYNVDIFGVGFGQEFQSIARSLHLTETMRLYMDGGRSLQAVLDHVTKGCNALEHLVKRMGD